MGVYVFRTDVLKELLNRKYPSSNDFGSEIIPSAVGDYNVQVNGILDSNTSLSINIASYNNNIRATIPKDWGRLPF